MVFYWLFDKINATIAAPEASCWGIIGVLDIYGFENFDSMNGFEQLLINYANEKLQNHFNKHIFQIEQAEYEAEAIDWSYITFNDNQACVDLIDSKLNMRSGIFQTLDDSVASGRLDVNANFLAQLNQTWGSKERHANYVAPRFNSDQRFGILHYAGEVFYEIESFAEKNRDSTNIDMKELMAKSTNKLLRAMTEDSLCADAALAAGGSTAGPAGANRANKAKKNGGPLSSVSSASSAPVNTSSKSGQRGGSFVSKLKEDSISKQFTSSLRQLYETLDSTAPHYVRCVKPNAYKAPDLLNAKDTLLQLKYAGMMETIRIRQQGYALRLQHDEFFKRYSLLFPSCKTLRELVSELSRFLSVGADSWQVGTTKLFLRRDMSEKLERLLWLRYNSAGRKLQRAWRFKRVTRAATVIQKIARGHAAKFYFVRVLRAVVLIQAVMRCAIASRKFSIVCKAVVEIQRLARGKIAKRRAIKLRNPYNRMS